MNKAGIHFLIERLLEKASELGVSGQLFRDTISEGSDWSFVVRLHTVVEASLNDRIIKALGDERLFSIISRLEVADQTRGKLAFIKALDLLPKEYQSFVKWFSELRNALVHKAQNLDFNIQDYLAKNPTLQNNFTTSLVKIFPKAGLPDVMESDPRTALLLGAIAVIVRESNVTGPQTPSESSPKES